MNLTPKTKTIKPVLGDMPPAGYGGSPPRS
uniref:Putative Glycosyl transferase, family 14 n=1 Tax=mine drainage metagenome TaxID=410659 RepID=E6QB42_9ZZZZ